MNSNLIPFDYNTWKTGNYDVVYRNGEVPLEWHWFENYLSKWKIISIYNKWQKLEHLAGGNLFSDTPPSGYDLMLRPKEKWIEGYLYMENGQFDALSANISASWGKKSDSIIKVRWNPIAKNGTIEEV